jgi:hypothetical protein
MVLSMKTSSKSASPASSTNTVCHTCARDHLAKRLYTLFQAPKSAGRSRHGPLKICVSQFCGPLLSGAPLGALARLNGRRDVKVSCMLV